MPLLFSWVTAVPALTSSRNSSLPGANANTIRMVCVSATTRNIRYACCIKLYPRLSTFGRATTRVAPTDGCRVWAGDHEGRPYGYRVWLWDDAGVERLCATGAAQDEALN